MIENIAIVGTVASIVALCIKAELWHRQRLNDLQLAEREGEL